MANEALDAFFEKHLKEIMGVGYVFYKPPAISEEQLKSLVDQGYLEHTYTYYDEDDNSWKLTEEEVAEEEIYHPETGYLIDKRKICQHWLTTEKLHRKLPLVEKERKAKLDQVFELVNELTNGRRLSFPEDSPGHVLCRMLKAAIVAYSGGGDDE